MVFGVLILVYFPRIFTIFCSFSGFIISSIFRVLILVYLDLAYRWLARFISYSVWVLLVFVASFFWFIIIIIIITIIIIIITSILFIYICIYRFTFM